MHDDLAATGAQRFTDWLPEPDPHPISSSPPWVSTTAFCIHLPFFFFNHSSTAVCGKGDVTVTLLLPLWIKHFLLLLVNLLLHWLAGHPLVLHSNSLQDKSLPPPCHQLSSKLKTANPFKAPDAKLLPPHYFLFILFAFTVLLYNPWGKQTAFTVLGRHALLVSAVA